MDALHLDFREDTLVVRLPPCLDMQTVPVAWNQIRGAVKKHRIARLVIDGSSLRHCDSAGTAFLLGLQQVEWSSVEKTSLSGLAKEMEERLTSASLKGLPRHCSHRPWLRAGAGAVGAAAYEIGSDFTQQLAFLGELVCQFLRLLAHPRRMRWRDMFLLAEKAGANAIGIVTLLGFLIGLILAFQSAVSMREFGAEAYVADLVVLTMFRELGPLITALILASRTGSAYAAELGTMKVNEELDALNTFGMDPMRFLVAPRVLAVILVIPGLALVNNLAGLLGCEAVMRGFGFSSAMYWERVTDAAGLRDLFGGLAKTLVFGFIVGAVGCLRGMQTGIGAGAVGNATTRAVVTCIILLIAADCVFAVVYCVLGI